MFFWLLNLAAEVKKGPHRCLTQSRAGDIEIWQVIVSIAGLVVMGVQAKQEQRSADEAKRSADRAKRSADRAKRSADEAKRSADEAFKASAEGTIQAAVAKVMKPFEPSNEEKEVIKRPVMGTIKDRIKSWKQHATIIGGRYLSGKSVAVEEALRGVRGVFRFTIENAEWKKMMYEQLNVDTVGMFKAVMSQVCEKLKDFPDNLTKHPILLLDLQKEDRMFDAGGNQRQKDIWVADLTEKEAKDCLSLHGHDNFDEFIDACVSAQFS